MKFEQQISKLETAEDIVRAITNRQELANEHRKSLNLEPTLYWCGILYPDMKNVVKQKIRVVENLDCIYNLQNPDQVLKTSVFSDITDKKSLIELKSSTDTETIEISYSDTKTKKQVHVNTLRKRKLQRNVILRKIKEPLPTITVSSDDLKKLYLDKPKFCIEGICTFFYKL